MKENIYLIKQEIEIDELVKELELKRIENCWFKQFTRENKKNLIILQTLKN